MAKKKRKKSRRRVKREEILGAAAQIRIPLPEKTGGYHSSKKGKRGYDRKNNSDEIRKQQED